MCVPSSWPVKRAYRFSLCSNLTRCAYCGPGALVCVSSSLCRLIFAFCQWQWPRAGIHRWSNSQKKKDGTIVVCHTPRTIGDFLLSEEAVGLGICCGWLLFLDGILPFIKNHGAARWWCCLWNRSNCLQTNIQKYILLPACCDCFPRWFYAVLSASEMRSK